MSNSKKDQILIDRDLYDSLMEDRRWVNALEGAGVDNWSGYDYAMELFKEEEDE